VFLARHLQRPSGSPDLAWWKLPEAVPDFLDFAGWYSGLICGAVGGAVGSMISWVLAGIALSFVLAAWPSYGLARIWLALRHRLPWSLMGFLVDAHRRGVLRQAGTVYQSRHIELQHRLVARDAPEPIRHSGSSQPM